MTVRKLGWRLRGWLGRLKPWIARSPARLVVALAVLGFVVLTIPSMFTVLAGFVWGCIRVRTSCAAGDIRLALGGFALVAAVYILAFYALRQTVGTIVWSRMTTVAPRESRCRVLVMGLSELRPLDPGLLQQIKLRFRGRAALYGLPRKDFEQLPAEAGAAPTAKLAIPWQQNVRAVLHHGARLEAVLVLPSQESLAQWPEFENLMAALFPGLAIDLVRGKGGEAFELAPSAGGPARSYEDYAYLLEGLSAAVRQVQLAYAADAEREPLDERDICVDVTAGPKTFSIAGAIVTLNRDLKLGYVSTEGLVTVFNAEIGTADALTRALRVR
jgi:hypothetical protein